MPGKVMRKIDKGIRIWKEIWKERGKETKGTGKIFFLN